jgi:hypothetical protein
VLLLSLSLIACGPPDDAAEALTWSAEASGAPPVALTLEVPDLVPGEPLGATVTGAEPGSSVHLAFGLTRGDGPCFGFLDGGCLDILRPKRIDTSVADGAGTATFDLVMPLSLAPGIRPTFQAVSFEPGLSEAVTSVVATVDAAPDFSLADLNETSVRFDEPVSPRDYLAKVSGWYFGHAT